MAASAGEALLPMFEDVVEMLALARAGFNRHDAAGLETAAALGRSIHKREKELTQELLAAPPEAETLRFQDLASEFARAHEERLIEGVCVPRASSAYLAILDYPREFVRHARQIASRAAQRGTRERGAPQAR